MKFQTRVKEIEPICSRGMLGTIVDNGTAQKNGDTRFLVRWDYSSTTIFGARKSNLLIVESEQPEQPEQN